MTPTEAPATLRDSLPADPTHSDAFVAAEQDPTIWKMSWLERGTRVRLVRVGTANGVPHWAYDPMERHLDTIDPAARPPESDTRPHDLAGCRKRDGEDCTLTCACRCHTPWAVPPPDTEGAAQ